MGWSVQGVTLVSPDDQGDMVTTTGDTFEPQSVAWVNTPRDLDWLCESIRSATEVVYDLETTGLDPHATRGGQTNGGVPALVVLASFTLPQPSDKDPTKAQTWVLPLAHPDSPWLGHWRAALREVAEAVAAANKPLVGQHVKFDTRWTAAHTSPSRDLSSRIAWDTAVSAHLMDENSSKELKTRAPAVFGIERWDDFDLSRPGAALLVPLIDLGLYAARDTYWTWRLAQHDREVLYLAEGSDEPVTPDEIEAARLGRLAVWCSMPTAATLGQIEARGMVLDRTWTEAALKENLDQADEMTRRLARRYPMPLDMPPSEASFAPTSLWFAEWAARAVDAGDLQITARTPRGKPQWTKSVLVRQARGGSEVARSLLDLRQASKRAEFLASWLKVQTPRGTVHATYNDATVVTGRLSSSGPNMQQITAALKPAWVPRPGRLFVDLDYGQIEMRGAAFISRDEAMMQAFRDGLDLHSMLAARITGSRIEDVTPEARQKGKSANFGLLYLISPEGFREYAETAYGVVMSYDEAFTVHRAFFEQWPGIADWHARTIHRAHRTGQSVSPLGRVRRLPDIHTGIDYLVERAERQAVNSPVQGFASDLMQMSAASIAGNLPGVEAVPDAWLVGTVHDSILVEVPEDNWQVPVLACMERMTGVGRHLKRLGCDLDVPLVADAKVSTRWGLADVWKS